MAKIATHPKREGSLNAIEPIKLKTRKGLRQFKPKEYLSNRKAVAVALVDCLTQGDSEGFKEILSAHLEVVNKTAFAKKAGIPERTLFRMLTSSGNPTLDNISRVFSALAKAS